MVFSTHTYTRRLMLFCLLVFAALTTFSAHAAWQKARSNRNFESALNLAKRQSRLPNIPVITPKAKLSGMGFNSAFDFTPIFPGSMFFQGPGIAPTGDPGQGFDIEGDLQANTPNANTTDWTPGVAGTGVGVLTAAGVPVNSSTTFHPVDLFDDQGDNIFTGGSKVNDNPNTNWSWTTGKATAKDDLNNGLLHISTDANDHLWFVVGGDRLSNNGDSHINFEFLQNTLVRNANGTFISAGPDGGRTVGDLLLHIDLEMGGIAPDFFVERWQAVGPGFDWVAITPAAGTVFVAANIAGAIPVSFGAFGSATYSMNQFAEGAIDITALIANLNPCIGIKTVLIKTATSQSPTAALKDFIDPIQVNLGTVPVATVNSPTVCAGSTASLTATVTGGAAPYTFSWSGPGGFTANTQMINVTTTGTYTVTVTSAQGCVSQPASGTVTINPTATVNAGPDQTVCATSPAVSLAGTIGGAATTATWSGGTGTFSPNANSLTALYEPSAAEITAGTVTLTLTTDDPAGPCPAVSDTITITINPAATVNAGPDQTVCANSPNVTLAGSFGGSATSATWSGGAGTFNPNANTLNAVYTPSTAEITAGTVTLTLMTDDPAGPCGAVSDSMTIFINPAATVDAGADIAVCSDNPAAQLNGSVGGGATSATWSGGAGTFNPNANALNATYTPTAGEIVAGMVTLTLTTDDPGGPCGVASDTVLITIDPAATVNAGPDQTVCAISPVVTLAGSAGGGASGGTWSGGAGTFNPNNTTLTATYTPTAGEIAAGTVTLMLTTNDPAGPCGAVSDTMTITINQAATVNAGADITVCATLPIAQLNGSVGGAAGSATWSGGAGTFNPNNTTLNATYTPTAGEIAAGMVTLTLTTNDPAGPCGAVSDQVVIFN